MATQWNIKEYFYDKTDVNNLLKNKSDTTHTHSEYLTEHQSLLDYLTSDQINTLLSSYALTNSLAAVATSGSYNDLSNKPSIPTKISELTNDSNFVLTTDSRLSDARTPTSHSHGNITNDGKIQNSVMLPVSESTQNHLPLLVPFTGGKIAYGMLSTDAIVETKACQNLETVAGKAQTYINQAIDTKIGEINTSLTNKSDITHTHSYDDLEDTPTNVSEFNNDAGYLTQANIENLGGMVSVEKQTTAESGYAATYIVKQGGTQVGAKINIPKDFLVKSASIGTATAANTPETGFAKGDKYLDFVINAKDNSATDEHLYINVKDLFNEYEADETTLTLNDGVFSIKSGVIPQANTTATNIKMNGTQSAGSATTYAKADHVHPTDTSRAAASHSHGNVTNDGKVGTTANKPLITGTNGVIQAGSFGTTANTFAQGNHTHSQYLTEHQDVSNKLEFADLEDMIGLSYDSTTGILSLTFTDN